MNIPKRATKLYGLGASFDSVNCNDSYIVEQVQRKIGVEVDGKWGCNSQIGRAHV